MAKTTSRTCQSRYVKHRYTKAGQRSGKASRNGRAWAKRPGYITELI